MPISSVASDIQFHKKMADFKKDFAILNGSLSIFEQQFVIELYPVIKRIVENFTISTVAYGEGSRYDTDSVHTRTISDYKEKIDRIVKLLDSRDQKLKKFVNNLPSWKSKRKQIKQKLQKIAENTIIIRKISNIVKIISSYAGLLGGMAIIVSVLLRPAEPSLLPDVQGSAAVSADLLRSLLLPDDYKLSPLTLVGGTATSIRAFVNTAVSLMELTLIESELREADEAIAYDRELLEQLGVLEFMGELNDAIDDLFGTSTSNRILGDLTDFLKKVPPILDEIEFLQLDALNRCLNSMLPNITEFLLIGTSLASAILSILFVAFLTRHRVCPILNHHLALCLANAVNANMEITGLIASGLEIFKLGGRIPKTFASKIGVCVVAGIRIALDRASINKNFIDLAKLKKVATTHSTVIVVNRIPRNVGHQSSLMNLPDEALVCATPLTTLIDGNHCQSCFCSRPVPTRKKNYCPPNVFLAFRCRPNTDQRMMAQVTEDTTIWDLSMMVKSVNSKQIQDRKLVEKEAIELLYNGNKMVEYHKTIRDFGINSSTATRENPAVLDLNFHQKDVVEAR